MSLDIQNFPAHPNNYSAIKTIKTGFVLHWIVGEITSADATFANPSRLASAHYGIGSNGEIHQYVPDEYVAWHAGNWSANSRYIGIEHAGGQLLPGQPTNSGVDGRKKPTLLCHQTSVNLITSLCVKFNISKLVRGQNIFAHRDIVPTACPGSLDIDWIISQVNQNLSQPKNYTIMLQDLVQKLRQNNVQFQIPDSDQDPLHNLDILANQNDWVQFNLELTRILQLNQVENDRKQYDTARTILQDQVKKMQALKLNLYNYDIKEDWGDNLEMLSNQGSWQLYNTELASILKMGQNELKKLLGQPL